MRRNESFGFVHSAILALLPLVMSVLAILVLLAVPNLHPADLGFTGKLNLQEPRVAGRGLALDQHWHPVTVVAGSARHRLALTRNPGEHRAVTRPVEPEVGHRLRVEGVQSARPDRTGDTIDDSAARRAGQPVRVFLGLAAIARLNLQRTGAGMNP